LWEREQPVPPLAAGDSYALFCRRAQAVQPSFEPGPEVEEICARMEGLPLAIELAAARTRVLPTAQLLARLDRRLPVLVGGARDLPERQRTLEATIGWSYELLSPDEQEAFARFSVFVDGATVDDAEEICETTLDVLETLVDNNLLQSAGGRLSMLETIHEYAAARLDDDRVRDRHLAHFEALALAAQGELHGETQAEWLDRLQHEHANIRAAIARAGGERALAI